VAPRHGGLVVLGSGAVPRLTIGDVRALSECAASGSRTALTNNRYSSDICAMGDAAVLSELPALPSDNALPRWLAEKADFAVSELGGRQRLALDIDSPLDVGLWAAVPGAPAWVRRFAASHELHVPRAAELRAVARDPSRQLLVFGRSGSTTLRWLERNVRCRVRFLAEERGLRASSPLAMGKATADTDLVRPRATLGRLIADRGPERLAAIIGELADAAFIDTRVLMADRFGSDESSWPRPADRYASDLHRTAGIADPWLRALTASASGSRSPIALGAHTLVGPGVPIVLRPAAQL